MSHEFTPQENARELWDAALSVLQTAEEGQQPRLLGQRIETIPPNSTEPEEIILHYEYGGSWRDVYRTLGFTALGPVSYRYENIHFDDPEDDDDFTSGPNEEATLEWLTELAQDVRDLNTRQAE